MSNQCGELYAFGPFLLDAEEGILRRDGLPVALTPKAFATLVALVEHGNHVLSKEELIERVWHDSYVEEGNLKFNIYLLRKALGESEDGRLYIETVPKRGYRFAANVRKVKANGIDLVSEEHVQTAPLPEEVHAETTGVTLPPVLAADGNQRQTNWRHRRVVLGACVLAVGLIVAPYWLWVSQRGAAQKADATIKSVAVLPFRPLVADGRNESLELGMADTLITKLSSTGRIIVRPISAVRKYADLTQDPLAAGREQLVDAVLDSSIQIVGEKIRVTARLVRVADGFVLWTDKSDQQYEDLFAVQDAIAEKLVGSLAVRLTDEEKQRLTKHYTENSDAHELYQWGRFYFSRRAPGGHNFKKGIEYFEQAIEKDPGFALAYVGLSDCYAGLGGWQIVPPKETYPQARAAAEKAVQLDDTLAEARTSLANVKMQFGDRSGAEAEYKRAIELNPNYEMAHHWYAMLLLGQGRLDEALTEMRRAQELDPRSLFINAQVGRVFYMMRQYDEAITQYQKVLEMDPNFAQAHLQLGWAYAQKGMYEEAITEYQTTIRLGGRPTFVAEIGRVYALSGKRREAQKVLDEMKELSKQGYVPAYDFALIYEGLGEKEEAITWLEKAYENGGGQHFGLKVNPIWDSLRSHSRFQDLLRRMGFPQ